MAAEDGNADHSADVKINVTPDAGARIAPGFLADSQAGQVQAASGNATLGAAVAGTESGPVVTGGANLPADNGVSGGLFFFPALDEAGVLVHEFSPLDVADLPGAGDPNGGHAAASVGGGGMTITLSDETRITFAGVLPVQPTEF